MGLNPPVLGLVKLLVVIRQEYFTVRGRPTSWRRWLLISSSCDKRRRTSRSTKEKATHPNRRTPTEPTTDPTTQHPTLRENGCRLQEPGFQGILAQRRLTQGLLLHPERLAQGLFFSAEGRFATGFADRDETATSAALGAGTRGRFTPFQLFPSTYATGDCITPENRIVADLCLYNRNERPMPTRPLRTPSARRHPLPRASSSTGL